MRRRWTDETTRRYFFPALTVKILGAIALGAIYQFYYEGGDTFNYFDWGSKYIWEAFKDSPAKAFQLIFAPGEYHPSTLNYAINIVTYKDPASYFIVRVAGFFDIFTFHTYSATACLFAFVSFTGMWALFTTFYRIAPALHKGFAIAALFIPSVFFWGSGIMKDSLTIGALGWLTYGIYHIFFRKEKIILNAMVVAAAAFVIYSIKIYILLCFLPAVILWVVASHYGKIRYAFVKISLLPIVAAVIVGLSYFAIQEVGETSRRYSLDKLSYTAESTARWIAYVSQREGGSYYTLGDFDYSTGGMIRKFIPAVWVTLFRPYLWEAQNPVMLLSALESFAILALAVFVFYKAGLWSGLTMIFKNPFVLFCLVFSIAFAFAVGFSTYNFGSLVRYKIPMLPFFISALFAIHHHAGKQKMQAQSDNA